MTKFIVVASGKGGVGKTTTAINLGTALNSYGRDVIVVDANLSTPNVGIYLGSPYVPITLHHVIKNKNHITEAVYQHKHGLKIIPGSISIEDSKKLEHDRLSDVLLDLVGMTEIVIIDSAAGIGEEATSAIKSGDEVIIITTPELPAVTDALKTVKLAKETGRKVIGIVLTRVRSDDVEMTKSSIEAILEHPIIAVIPEDENIREAHYMKNPVTYTHPNSGSSVSYKKLAAKLLGEKYIQSVEKKEGLLDYILKRLGLA